ncbi:Uma2 family endonuclease [Candidatus Thiothrix sp. Deng01]|uniref:Uma2 family endonuclease n=1 Tax=Candidatus Thiothrix phosphatis TaxID=3112415 RepID=A0ABU6CUP4_9GAMM|nr:Uma2 family endonuclease [Candidatus Thiothrix sp. Deng01]MEB4590561.1 Uma2 family endonuclease [Candidatus Thiothrix sp. Deng01]
MSLAKQHTFLSIEDFLAGEQVSEARHEYVDGVAYAMAGGSVNHNLISGNVYRLLGNHLASRSCTPFTADMLVKTTQTRFRYPDVAVFCGEFSGDETYLDNPVLLVEVLSRSTRQNDKGSKLTEYLALPSLQEYVLIEQDFVEIQVLRRRNGWRLESYYLGQSIVFESVGASVSVEAIYLKVNNGDVREWLEKAGAGSS